MHKMQQLQGLMRSQDWLKQILIYRTARPVMDAASKAEIGSLVQAAEAPGAPLVATVNQVLRALERRGFVRYQRIEAQLVAVHPMNRDGAGVGWRDVHSLMKDILDLGYDPSQPNPVCCECGDSMKTDAMVFNQKLSAESAGRTLKSRRASHEVSIPQRIPLEHHIEGDPSRL